MYISTYSWIAGAYIANIFSGYQVFLLRFSDLINYLFDMWKFEEEQSTLPQHCGLLGPYREAQSFS